MKKKVYLNRHPRIGDIVEGGSDLGTFAEHKSGYEYRVVKLGFGYILATGERLPGLKKEIMIPDGHYNVIEYKEIPQPKEKHVKVYRFLGIPFGKRITYIYEESK